MLIKFPKENLQKAINTLQKAAQNKVNSNLPGGIYLSAKDNKVELQANNFSLGIKTTVDAQVIEPGTMFIGTRYFQELVKRLSGNVIELNKPEGSNKLVIKSEQSEFTLHTLNVDDFTFVEQISEQNSILIDADDMKQLIDLTSFAAATDEDRPVFSGCLLELKNNAATMVATDTHRMAIKKIEVKEPIITEMRAIIPVGILSELSRLLPIDNPTFVKIIWNQSQVAFLFDNVYLLSKLIDGVYPDYEKVIPLQFDANVKISRRDFADAVDRICLLAKDISYNIIRYDWSDKEVILSSKNSEIGGAKDIVACDLKGRNFTISFNGKYFTDILRHSTSDDIHLSLKENGPVVIRQDNNQHYTYVVTPVRTN